MSSYNRVILMGRLTRDPELRYTQNQMPVVNAALAMNRRYKSGEEWREEVTFVDVTIFGKRGEAFEKYHKKGDAAFVEGSLRQDSWEDKKTGQKRSKLYVVADSWEFVNSGGGGDDQPRQQPPQRARAPQPAGAGAYDFPAPGGGQAPPKKGEPDWLEDEDTPF